MRSLEQLGLPVVVCLALALSSIPAAVAHAEVLRVDPDGTLEGRPGDEKIVSVPDELWRPTGTLSFRFRASRTLRFTSHPEGKPERMTLVACPLLRADLSEDRKHTILKVSLPAEGDYEPAGTIFWSHLKGGEWYHLALSWDAARGKLEAYLNGVLQEEIRLRGAGRPWTPPASPSGPLRLGGSLGAEDRRVAIAVDSVALYPTFMDEEDVVGTLEGCEVAPLEGEGRTDFAGELDLAPYKLTSLYEADFSRPLDVVYEKELFDGDRRARLPEGSDWVFEGPGRAWTDGGRLHLESSKPQESGHIVLWSTRVFPDDYLIEFGMSPKDSSNGLNIVFLSAMSREGGGIFDLGLPRRDGVFKNYHSGALDSYHVSYWACASADGGTLRRTANVRKNFGFYLVGCGIDRIAGRGPGPHRVRVLKVGGMLRVETAGRIAAGFDDDGSTYGPVRTGGAVGLRQMGHTHRASYTHFKVWKVEPRGTTAN